MLDDFSKELRHSLILSHVFLGRLKLIVGKIPITEAELSALAARHCCRSCRSAPVVTGRAIPTNWATSTLRVSSGECHWVGVPGKHCTLAAASSCLLPFQAPRSGRLYKEPSAAENRPGRPPCPPHEFLPSQQNKEMCNHKKVVTQFESFQKLKPAVWFSKGLLPSIQTEVKLPWVQIKDTRTSPTGFS